MEKVCKNCKNIVPHVYEYIDNEWKYYAKCIKVCEGGKLLTIPDRDTHTCERFEESTIIKEK